MAFAVHGGSCRRYTGWVPDPTSAEALVGRTVALYRPVAARGALSGLGDSVGCLLGGTDEARLGVPRCLPSPASSLAIQPDQLPPCTPAQWMTHMPLCPRVLVHPSALRQGPPVDSSALHTPASSGCPVLAASRPSQQLVGVQCRGGMQPGSLSHLLCASPSRDWRGDAMSRGPLVRLHPARLPGGQPSLVVAGGSIGQVWRTPPPLMQRAGARQAAAAGETLCCSAGPAPREICGLG